MRAALAAVLLVACSQPAPAPVAQPKPVVAEVPADAPAVTQEETLAAIQKAMNELDEGAQACWARAATDRLDIEGQFVAQVTIGDANVGVRVVQDTAKNTVLATCMTTLLMAYRWAPPLHYQTIQLPFSFRAPDGQSVIDRRLVEAHAQGNISVAVLLDESNTGNGAASMFELHAPTSTGVRKADRAELWFFLTPGMIGTDQVAAGDMAFVAAGALREIKGNAVRVTVPGGMEGAARAGALPTPLASGKQTYKVLRAAQAKTYGPAQIFLDANIEKTAPMAASILSLPSGANVPEHVHAKETEMLYIIEGAGTMTVAGQAVAVTPTSVIQIPPNTKHAFAATANVRALQIYTPPGPEQRFKKQ
jgi:quercetin dioxygenase-like cupin family protein